MLTPGAIKVNIIKLETYVAASFQLPLDSELHTSIDQKLFKNIRGGIIPTTGGLGGGNPEGDGAIKVNSNHQIILRGGILGAANDETVGGGPKAMLGGGGGPIDKHLESFLTNPQEPLDQQKVAVQEYILMEVQG